MLNMLFLVTQLFESFLSLLLAYEMKIYFINVCSQEWKDSVLFISENVCVNDETLKKFNLK